ncbi:hypothetical protein NDU88_005627 [Pleurodeles waltl]|uniref:Uncharacterized protein n=1 Tax=Pleurodeles waltl TaxID=8319 RepID=A0AAV7PJ33_PLEWA|nr:hypothetical protein NDU88_005627 [Pleurodeles waltl]
MNNTFDVLVLKRKRRIRVCVYLPFRPRWNVATVSGWSVVQTRGAGSRRGRRTPELTRSSSSIPPSVNKATAETRWEEDQFSFL